MKDQNGRNGERVYTGEAFRMRMEAQCQLIDRYRLKVLREQHRKLSRDEAALEWIERYADSFHWRDSACEDGHSTKTNY